MSKKIIIIVTIFLSILLIFLVGYYFLISGNKDGGSGPIVSGFKGLFPFGKPNDNPVIATTTPENPTPEEPPINNFAKRLRKISSEPVAGAGEIDIKAGTVVRYIEIATGHIYEVEMFSPKKERISNTTIPIAYNALWGNKNNSLVAQYLKDDNETIDTYSLSLKNISTTTENPVSATALSKNITNISVNNNEIFYLTEGVNKSDGYISDFENKKVRQIWDSNINQLNSQFINSKFVGLTTKPATNMPGYMYLVNTSNGETTSILGGTMGLSTLSDPSANNILYLENSSVAKMGVYSTKNATKTKFNLSTFPEKCVWSKKNTTIIFCAVPRVTINSNSLIAWYQGIISTNDDIWKYDLKDGSFSIVGLLSPESGETIDVIKPILTENEQYIIFINKKDNSLWSLDLLQ